MGDFTEEWTEKTFTNQDGQILRVRAVELAERMIEIEINGETFWFSRDKAGDICKAISSLSSN